jgi:hypothetical protein
MLLHFLNRIENMLKLKSREADTEADFAGPPGTDAATDVGAQTFHGAGSACSVADLLNLLNVIRGNAEFLEVVYGDSLPVKNIMAATKKACETAQSINKTGSGAS